LDRASVVRLNGPDIVWIKPGEGGDLRGRNFDWLFQNEPNDAFGAGRRRP
jgi:hypothetical protein